MVWAIVVGKVFVERKNDESFWWIFLWLVWFGA